MEENKTVIVVAGPTAVGKTAFAIDLARLLDTEIISADSRQCYREMDIGVARPSAAELAQVKHHFINSHSVHDEVNAVVFEKYALDAASAIFSKRNVAVMVGGTGLYIKAFCEGLDDIPPVDPLLRRQITGRYEQEGLDWLQQEVRRKDPAFWADAEQQNPHRLIRALEVMESTGVSITTFRKGIKQIRPFNIIKIGLELPRETLYERIDRRVDQMMAAGLENEVRQLLPLRHLPALQTVGYREAFAFFDGNITLQQAVSEIKKNSRHYARRQLTWFRKGGTIRWFSATSPAAVVLDQLQGAGVDSFDKR